MRPFFLLLAFLLLLGPVVAIEETTERMKPKAPVKNFRLPRFGENGYTQWVLRGSEGIYQSAEQIDVKEMALRIYSGDERMAVELSLDSPEAAILLADNRAVSDVAIEIVGESFRISGVGWSWDGATKQIDVNSQSKVEFYQDLGDTLMDVGPGSVEGGEETTICSERLSLRTSPDGYFFEFTNNVRVESGDMELTSQTLITIVDAPEGREDMSKPDVPTAESKLDSVRQIIAREDVVIRQVDRVIYAGEANFFPREESVRLSGLPRVEMPGAFLSGETIRTHKGRVLVTGDEDGGRAQMILTETGGLGIQGATTLSEETIVLSNKILMRETETDNQFIFEGRVDVMSGAITQRSDKLTVRAHSQSASKPEGDALKVGEVYKLVAEGNVDIQQNTQRVTADKVTYHPLQETAQLTGNPQVSDGDSVIRGQLIDLKPGRVIVHGTKEECVVVVLPVMPDLGYDPSISALGSTEEVSKAQPVEASETIVKSERVEMIEHPEKTLFRFIDSVEVTATNLEATCGQMDVSASAPEGDSDSGRDLKMDRIVARDNVVILQTERIATSDEADILPDEGKVVLTGNASVDDVQGKVTGHRITLNKGKRRALVEGGGSNDGRARITIPGFDTGSF